ncbi:hypothetical protein AKJ09_11367 [Labilithrix luteola]|uniref:Uncharacterized protein n=1 Tax=Labilithrix luteola TaxID=1391654 RepID=A0A0K1QG27_9BACT|nr:hypothetical protein AKJ09_11367 [Labilithrix luteola]
MRAHEAAFVVATCDLRAMARHAKRECGSGRAELMHSTHS